MQPFSHSLPELFKQLGLPCGEEDIRAFIKQHKPLPGTVALEDADFWEPDQAEFIREARAEDADWAILVDELDELLRD